MSSKNTPFDGFEVQTIDSAEYVFIQNQRGDRRLALISSSSFSVSDFLNALISLSPGPH